MRLQYHAFVFIFIACLIPQTTKGSNGFKKVLKNNKADKHLVKKLKTFESKGIEKDLDTQKASKKDIIEHARSFIGVPHCMGGTTKKCIDCSGFLSVIFNHFDIYLPHSAQGIARYGEIIPEADKLKKGDLVFFTGTYSTSKAITHVGIYLGDNNFIHASKSNGVEINQIDDPYYWEDKFIFGTRIF
jgi:cell wall-associated NlpC family hydrolase